MSTPESDTQNSIMISKIIDDIKNMKYNYMNDALFKFVFGNGERSHVTTNFLNAVLELEGESAIKNIRFCNIDAASHSEANKFPHLVIECFTEKDELLVIGVHIFNEKGIKQQALYQWAQMYYDSAFFGTNYTLIKSAITINILRYNLFPEDNDFHSMFGLSDEKTGNHFGTVMEMHFFEIPKLQKKSIKEMLPVERWLAYLSNRVSEKELEEITNMEVAIQIAKDSATVFMLDEKRRNEYLKKELAILDYESDEVTSIKEGVTP